MSNSTPAKELLVRWEELVSSGEVEQADALSKNYIAHLLKRKNIGRGFEFIEVFEKRNNNPVLVQYSKFTFFLLQGNFVAANDVLQQSVENKRVYRQRFWTEIINTAGDLLDGEDVNWQQLTILLNLKIEYSFKKILNNVSCFADRKEFLKLIYERILQGGDIFSYVEKLLSYSILFRRKEMATVIFESLEGRDVSSVEIDDRVLTKKDIERLISSMPEQTDDELSSEFDLGTDLFKSLASAIPDNNSKEIGPPEVAVGAEGEKIKLLKAFICHSSILKEKDVIEQPLFKIIDCLEDDKFERYYMDIAVSFFMMDLHKVTNYIITLAERRFKGESQEQQNKLAYLKIANFIASMSFFDALRELEIVFLTFPLVEHEEVCFMYLKAEVLFLLDRKKEALKYFRKVQAKKTNYRLTKQRVTECEQS